MTVDVELQREADEMKDRVVSLIKAANGFVNTVAPILLTLAGKELDGLPDKLRAAADKKEILYSRDAVDLAEQVTTTIRQLANTAAAISAQLPPVQ